MSKAFSCILIAAIVLSAAGCRNHRPDSLSKPAQQAEPAVIAKTMNQGKQEHLWCSLHPGYGSETIPAGDLLS